MHNLISILFIKFLKKIKHSLADRFSGKTQKNFNAFSLIFLKFFYDSLLQSKNNSGNLY